MVVSVWTDADSRDVRSWSCSQNPVIRIFKQVDERTDNIIQDDIMEVWRAVGKRGVAR